MTRGVEAKTLVLRGGRGTATFKPNYRALVCHHGLMSLGPSDRKTAAESKRRASGGLLAWIVASVSGAGSTLLVVLYVLVPAVNTKVGIMPEAVLPVAALIVGLALVCYIAADYAIQIREMNVWLSAIQDRAELGAAGQSGGVPERRPAAGGPEGRPLI